MFDRTPAMEKWKIRRTKQSKKFRNYRWNRDIKDDLGLSSSTESENDDRNAPKEVEVIRLRSKKHFKSCVSKLDNVTMLFQAFKGTLMQNWKFQYMFGFI